MTMGFKDARTVLATSALGSGGQNPTRGKDVVLFSLLSWDDRDLAAG